MADVACDEPLSVAEGTTSAAPDEMLSDTCVVMEYKLPAVNVAKVSPFGREVEPPGETSVTAAVPTVCSEGHITRVGKTLKGDDIARRRVGNSGAAEGVLQDQRPRWIGIVRGREIKVQAVHLAGISADVGNFNRYDDADRPLATVPEVDVPSVIAAEKSPRRRSTAILLLARPSVSPAPPSVTLIVVAPETSLSIRAAWACSAGTSAVATAMARSLRFMGGPFKYRHWRLDSPLQR